MYMYMAGHWTSQTARRWWLWRIYSSDQSNTQPSWNIHKRNEPSHPAFTPSCRASPHFARYSFLVQQRVGGCVGPDGWLHTEVVCQPEDSPLPSTIRGKIIRTALCRVVYDSCAQWYAHTCDQFLHFLHVSFIFIFVYLLRFCLLCVLSC